MSITFDPIELTGSLKCSRNALGGAGTRRWKCKWEDVDTVAPVPGVSKFTDGLSWPASWRDQLVCTNVEISPEGAGQPDLQPGQKEYTLAEVVAEYASTMTTDGSWEFSWQAGEGQMLNLGTGRTWASDGKVSDMPLAVWVPQISIVASKVFVSSATQRSAILAAQNKINATTWSAPWGEQYGAETLKFMYADLANTPDLGSGTILSKITYHFTYQPTSHNYVWRSDTGTSDHFSPELYATTDFSLMTTE